MVAENEPRAESQGWAAAVGSVTRYGTVPPPGEPPGGATSTVDPTVAAGRGSGRPPQDGRPTPSNGH
ncbi:hypothetical protein [Halohasta salina]|uniref:hypothetical protein n=1 Tax=Halohasta salina TaxID=2961621 RepID=UPI0020A485FE|nr:hypothetical protein [Halohasta salina]